MKRLLLLALAGLCLHVSVDAQTTLTYPQRVANYYTGFNDGQFTGIYDNGSFQVGMYATGTGNKRTAYWRKFRTTPTGNSPVSDRALQVGDVFTVTLSASRAYGRMGFALLASPSTSTWSDRESNYALSVNLDGPLNSSNGDYGAWYVKYKNGAASAGDHLVYGQQGSNKSFTFTIAILAQDRANVTISDGSTTSYLFDLQLNTSNPITDYSIFLEDNWDGGSNNNILWGLGGSTSQHSLTNNGDVSIGSSNGSFTIGTVISDGLQPNSSNSPSVNTLTKNGLGDLTLTGANTYTGNTTINGGKLILARSGGNTLPAGSNVIINSGTQSAINNLTVSSNQTVNNLTINNNATVTVPTGVTLTINGTCDLYQSAAFTGGGTVVMGAGSTLKINNGSWPGNSNTFTWNSSATLQFANTGSSYSVSAGDTYWNDSNYPGTVLVGSGGVTLNAARTGVTNVTLNGPLTLDANLTLAGSSVLTLNGGSSISGSGLIQYSGTNTSLVYNTGTAIATGKEWGNAAGSAPGNVTIQGSGTSVTLAGNRQTGGLNLAAGSLIAGANSLSISGSLTRTAGTLNLTGSTLTFNGSSAQTVAAGSLGTVGTLIVNNPVSVQVNDDLAIGTSLNLVSGLFDLNGHNLTISNGASLTRASGSINRTPVYGSGSTLSYTNSSASTAGPELAAILQNLTIGGAKVTLAGNATVNGTLTLRSGLLDLGAYDLSVAAITGGSATSYVQTSGAGVLTRKNVTAAGATFPVGNSHYNPVTVSGAATQDWSVRVEDNLTNVRAPFTGNVASAVNRMWHLTPSLGSSLAQAATVSFTYNEATDVNASFDGSKNVMLWHYGGINWFRASGSVAPSGTPGGFRTLTVGGLTEFSPYAISNFDAPLPVTFLSFTGKRANNVNELKWVTASESNNRGFAVERSLDGATFTQVGFVASRAQGGNSTSDITYSYSDATSTGTRWYYRLKQVDLDGRSKYSAVVLLKGDKSAVLTLDGVYPNPVQSVTNIRLQASATGGNITLQLSDMQGRIVRTQSVGMDAGAATSVAMNLQGLAAGQYHLVAVDAQGVASETVTVVKQ